MLAKALSADMADDILDGAEEIAVFMYGDKNKRRRVYSLIEAGHLPIFRLGSSIHARKSAIRAFIEERERQSVIAAA